MAFDPNKPTAGTLTDAAEMRAQLNALKALIDAQAAQVTLLTPPVLTGSRNSSGDFMWTWFGPDPDHWDYETSSDGVQFAFYARGDGVLRNDSLADVAPQLRLRAMNAAGSPASAYSNVVWVDNTQG